MTADSLFDFTRSPVEIPARFRHVIYNSDHFPGAPDVRGVEGGANCQQYAYELLRARGHIIPDFRSSELWEDAVHTEKIDELEPFCLVLINREPRPWGAHVGVGLGSNLVLHLSKAIGIPAIETLDEMTSRQEYTFLVGIKRVLARKLDGPRQ